MHPQIPPPILPADDHPYPIRERVGGFRNAKLGFLWLQGATQTKQIKELQQKVARGKREVEPHALRAQTSFHSVRVGDGEPAAHQAQAHTGGEVLAHGYPGDGAQPEAGEAAAEGQRQKNKSNA